MQELKLRKILVPTDFSEGSRAALEYAVQLADAMRAAVEVVHTWTVPAYVSPTVAVQFSATGETRPLEALVRSSAETEMQAFLAEVEIPERVPVKTRILFGEPDRVVLEAAKEHDLIVMGTHGRAGLSRVLLGSVAEKIIRQATCPVLTVKAR